LTLPRARIDDGSNNSNSSTNPTSPPWALMGRVVTADAVDQTARETLVARAVAERCAITADELERRLAALSALLPTLASRLRALHAGLLSELVADVDGVAQKLLRLRLWFPMADLGRVVGRRPSLLGADEWARVPRARRQLLRRFGGSGGGEGNDGSSDDDSDSANEGEGRPSPVVDELVTRQPALLAEDVDALLEELARCADFTRCCFVCVWGGGEEGGAVTKQWLSHAC
jgi:hypothetical protein